MRQASTILAFETRGRGLVEITRAVGTWQGIYLAEHRRRGHHRQVAVHLIGE